MGIAETAFEVQPGVNEAMIKICKSGHLAKMRHLSRTHKVNIAFTAERFREDPNICIDENKSVFANPKSRFARFALHQLLLKVDMDFFA